MNLYEIMIKLASKYKTYHFKAIHACLHQSKASARFKKKLAVDAAAAAAAAVTATVTTAGCWG